MVDSTERLDIVATYRLTLHCLRQITGQRNGRRCSAAGCSSLLNSVRLSTIAATMERRPGARARGRRRGAREVGLGTKLDTKEPNSNLTRESGEQLSTPR